MENKVVSIDTPEFRHILSAFHLACHDPLSRTETKAVERVTKYIITHIDAHCAAQVAEWKTNHADMVKRRAILRERDDLPVDRLPAFRQLARLQEAARTAAPAVGALTYDHIMDIAEPFHDVDGVLFNEVKFARATLAAASKPEKRDTALREAVGKLIKAKGRFHTEQNYAALVAAYDQVMKGETK